MNLSRLIKNYSQIPDFVVIYEKLCRVEMLPDCLAMRFPNTVLILKIPETLYDADNTNTVSIKVKSQKQIC